MVKLLFSLFSQKVMEKNSLGSRFFFRLAVPGPPLPSSSRTHGLAAEYSSLRSNGLPPPLNFENGTIPPPSSSTDEPLPTSSSSSDDKLRLGPAPMNPILEKEVKRKLGDLESDFTDKIDPLEVLRKGGDLNKIETNSNSTMREEDKKGRDQEEEEGEGGGGSMLPVLLAPFPSDLPPYPNSLRTIDVQREVELVREARKRIRLGAEAYYPEMNQNGGGPVGVGLLGGAGGEGKEGKEDKGKKVGKPSVCLFTIHDAGDS